MKLRVKVMANSKIRKIEDLDGLIKVHLTSQPIKGKANKELIELLAEHFNISKSKILITKGFTSRIKEVEIKDKNKE